MAAHHGNHGVTFHFEPNKLIESARAVTKAARSGTLSDKSVVDAEQTAVALRRQHIKELPPPPAGHAGGKIRRRDRSNSPRTGLALSGGGIRSASFGLGALQGL